MGVAPNKWTYNPLLNAHVQAGGAIGVRAAGAGVHAAGVAQGGVVYNSLVDAHVQAGSAAGARAVVAGVR